MRQEDGETGLASPIPPPPETESGGGGETRSIALIGMMGSGKTTIGRRLAKLLGWAFIDTDALVEERAGKTISRIFAEDGEAAFRRMEAEAIRDAVSAERTVVATGGGAVLRKENRMALWGRCWVVWLAATPEEHFRRVAASNNRPLLKGYENPVDAARALLAQRQPLYEAADHREDTTGRAKQDVTRAVMAAWRRAQNGDV